MRKPMVPLVLFFAGGIGLREYLGPLEWLYWLLVGMSIALAVVLALKKSVPFFRFLLWSAAFVGLGLLRGGGWVESGSPPTSERVVVTGVARSGWQRFDSMCRFDMRAESYRHPGSSDNFIDAVLRVTVWKNPEAKIECPLILPGDRLSVWVRMKPPHSSRNPGVSDRLARLRREKVDWLATAGGCETIWVEESTPRFSLRRMSEGLRDKILDAVESYPASEASKGIVAALSVGERGLLPQTVKDSFQSTGLMHLLAISGLHVGLVALGMYLLFCRMLMLWPAWRPHWDVRKVAGLMVIPVVIFYTLLAGAALPAVRACVMAVVFLSALVLERDTDPLQTLAASAMIILIAWPQSLFEVSFWLSFSAVFFIVIGVPRFAKAVGLRDLRQYSDKPRHIRWGVRLGYMFLVSVAATLGTAPWVVKYFNQLSLIGPFINLIAIPLVCWVIVPLGLLAAVFVLVSDWLVNGVIGLNLWIADWLSAAISELGAWSGANIILSMPGMFELCAWLAGLGALILALPKGNLPSVQEWSLRRKARWIAVLSGLVLMSIFGWKQYQHWTWDHLQVTFIDVQQGDGILVRFPSGKTLLVDAGQAWEGKSDTGRWVVAPFLWGQGIRRLDFVAVTHRDSDHAGGLWSIVNMFKPKELWINAKLGDVPLTSRLERLARDVGIKIRQLRIRDKAYREDGCEVDVVWPSREALDLGENERSLVLKIHTRQHAVLLTGDLEAEGEQRLLAQNLDIRSDVLKIGHHGSRQAAGDELLERVRPKIAVISVGAHNRHNLPHRELLDRLMEKQIEIYRTDHHGAITVDLHAGAIKVSPWVVEN